VTDDERMTALEAYHQAIGNAWRLESFLAEEDRERIRRAPGSGTTALYNGCGQAMVKLSRERKERHEQAMRDLL
jgi:hypothetical protein